MHSFASRSTRQMGQRDCNHRAGIEVRYIKCQISIGNHYSDSMQASRVLPSVSRKVITGRAVSHLVCPGYLILHRIYKCVTLNFCA